MVPPFALRCVGLMKICKLVRTPAENALDLPACLAPNETEQLYFKEPVKGSTFIRSIIDSLPKWSNGKPMQTMYFGFPKGTIGSAALNLLGVMTTAKDKPGDMALGGYTLANHNLGLVFYPHKRGPATSFWLDENFNDIAFRTSAGREPLPAFALLDNPNFADMQMPLLRALGGAVNKGMVCLKNPPVCGDIRDFCKLVAFEFNICTNNDTCWWLKHMFINMYSYWPDLLREDVYLNGCDLWMALYSHSYIVTYVLSGVLKLKMAGMGPLPDVQEGQAIIFPAKMYCAHIRDYEARGMADTISLIL